MILTHIFQSYGWIKFVSYFKSSLRQKPSKLKKCFFLVLALAKTAQEDSNFQVLPVCLNWKKEAVSTENLVTRNYFEK